MTTFSQKLLFWYDQKQRVLPWRSLKGQKPNPYHVWLSEIMLQQTTVVTVIPYFQKFLTLWPTISDMAEASIDEILHAWQGLGYYSRAHNLHKAAQIIAFNFEGIFPEEPEELMKLPGIGPYTSAAISAIGFNKPSLVIDGNVERVLARLYSLPYPPKENMTELRSLLSGLLPQSYFGDFAQAMMELGATLCTPRNPKCSSCPVHEFCQSFQKGEQDLYPKEKEKGIRPRKYGVAFWIENQKGEIWIRKRSQRLLRGLMEIPSTDWRPEKWSLEQAIELSPCPDQDWQSLRGSVKHVFTHFELHLNIIKMNLAKSIDLPEGVWCSYSDLEKHAFPTLMRKVIDLLKKNLTNASFFF